MMILIKLLRIKEGRNEQFVLDVFVFKKDAAQLRAFFFDYLTVYILTNITEVDHSFPHTQQGLIDFRENKDED